MLQLLSLVKDGDLRNRILNAKYVFNFAHDKQTLLYTVLIPLLSSLLTCQWVA